MKGYFDFEKEYGVVLEGGGAKGAYQIGVWKALIEYGVKIKGISGVSVGALNGALICMGDYDNAKAVWENITYSQVMNVNDMNMDHLIKGDLSEVSFSELRKSTTKIITDRGIDVTPLKELIMKHINIDKIINSPIELIINTISLTKKKELDINIKEVEPDLICDYLMSSCYFPAFKNEKLHGQKYLDGGVVNNVPINHLIERGYKDIIVIRIYGIGLEKNVKVPEDVNIIEIAPTINLGNILEFDNRKAKRNMKLGYYDGLRCIRSLEGKNYYIDGTHPEDYYGKLFAQVSMKGCEKLLTLYHIEKINPTLFLRKLFEEIYPLLAKDLKLDKDWSYKDLFLAMLEVCAKSIKIQKYQIYFEIELCNLICKKVMKMELKQSEHAFVVEAVYDIIKELNLIVS